jgi:hypothetical protein
MDSQLNTVLTNTYTIEDAFRRLSMARQFIENVFFGREEEVENWRLSLEKFLAARGGEPATRAALAAWGEQWFKAFKPDDINEKFVVLESAIEDLPELTIVVPVALPPAEVSRLGQWARVNADPYAMVALRIDPQAVGGCIIVWQGLYLDVSVRYFFAKHREAISGLIGGGNIK